MEGILGNQEEEKKYSIPEKKDGHLGLSSRVFARLMEEKCPGLIKKIDAIKIGTPLNLTDEEKNFFVDLIMKSGDPDELPGVDSLIEDIARRIWGGDTVEYMGEGNKHKTESSIASFWWRFCSSSLSRNRAKKLIEFFLETTKEQAEKEVSSWEGYWRKKYGKYIKIVS